MKTTKIAHDSSHQLSIQRAGMLNWVEKYTGLHARENPSVRIGLLEDDLDQAALVKLWLTEAGHEVTAFHEGKPFLESVLNAPYDLLMLDWELPDLPGPEVLKTIREQLDWNIPVIFATQRDSEQDIVHALEAGADDYMVKPVKQRELIARSVALARRAGLIGNEPDEISLGHIKLYKPSQQAMVNGEEVKLTDKEFELIYYLMQNQGRLISRDHLLEKLWGKGQAIQTRTVDMHVSRVRKKLNINPAMGYRIKTIYQHGYRLEAISESEG